MKGTLDVIIGLYMQICRSAYRIMVMVADLQLISLFQTQGYIQLHQRSCYVLIFLTVYEHAALSSLIF